ncbi:MAG: hypothetical protein MESAZ_00049 [Saezia sanguinis]
MLSQMSLGVTLLFRLPETVWFRRTCAQGPPHRPCLSTVSRVIRYCYIYHRFLAIDSHATAIGARDNQMNSISFL